MLANVRTVSLKFHLVTAPYSATMLTVVSTAAFGRNWCRQIAGMF